MKQLTKYLFLLLLFSSCADSKTFVIDGKTTVVEPYGWANSEAMKNEDVIYQVSAGNVVWSILLVETIVAPILITGWYLYEPVKLIK